MELLEREPYLEELEEAYTEVSSGTGCAILLSGEAGIGKTSLVERFTSSHQNAIRVWWGVCDSLYTPRPLGPLYDIAAQIQGNLLDRIKSETNRSAIFTTFLVDLQNKPTIVVIEDTHWADDATLDFIKFIGRRIRRTLALLIITYRDDELNPHHPLLSVLGDLATSPGVRRIVLQPFTESAMRVLVGARAMNTNALYHLTGGNPFFVTEVLSSAGGGIPATIRDVVLARSARLTLSAQAVLQAAAVIGPRIEPWVLSGVTGDKASATEECLSAGILITQADILTFRHELARETILETISPQRKQQLHRQTLHVLMSSPAARDDLARLAHHAEASGDRDAVLEFAPAAALQAVSAGAHHEAAAFFNLALQAGEDVEAEKRGLWLEAYAAELHIIGALEESTKIRRKAIDTLRAAGNHHREGLNMARLAVTLLNTGKPAQAWQASQEALELLQGLPAGPELALAQRTKAHLLMLNRDCEEALRWGNRAIQLAEQFNDRETLLQAYTTVGAALLVTDYEQGRATLEKCMGLFPEPGWEFGVANLFANLGSISCEVFRLREAKAYLLEGLSYTSERDLDFLKKYMLSWYALTSVYMGRWEEARQCAEEGLQGTGITVIGRIPALVAMGRLLARQGKASPMIYLDEALELSMQSQTLQRMSLVRTARAEAAWLAGDMEKALDEACAIYELVVSKRHPWFAGELAFWRWRAGDEIPVPEWIAKPYALQIAGDWRNSALTWEHMGCPYEQARSLADGDLPAQISALELYERLGAQSAAECVRQKLQAAGVDHLPRKPRASTRGNPFGLTDRQVEILALIIEGLSNADIASRLHITPKTADHHVSAILEKLNVHSRRAAASLAIQNPRFQKR